MRLTHTQERPNWILPTCTSRHAWRFSKDSPLTVCQTRVVLLYHKTSTLRLISQAHWVAVRLLLHGVLMASLLLGLRHQRSTLPVLVNGVTALLVSRTMDHHRR